MKTYCIITIWGKGKGETKLAAKHTSKETSGILAFRHFAHPKKCPANAQIYEQNSRLSLSHRLSLSSLSSPCLTYTGCILSIPHPSSFLDCFHTCSSSSSTCQLTSHLISHHPPTHQGQREFVSAVTESFIQGAKQALFHRPQRRLISRTYFFPLGVVAYKARTPNSH